MLQVHQNQTADCVSHWQHRYHNDAHADYERVLRLVCRARGVRADRVLHSARGPANVIAARHLAMYLLHVVLSQPLTHIGYYFNRDRTSVAHACARMEDARDAGEFDLYVSVLERQVEELVGGVSTHE